MKQTNTRTAEVYQAIVEYMVANNGRPPSTRDILQMTSITSTSIVIYHRNKLLREGMLTETEEPVAATRRMGLVSAVYAVPRNVALGNLDDIVETSIFVDGRLELAEEISNCLIDQGHTVHWWNDFYYASRILHHLQVAVITNNPDITLKAVAFGAAVYLPENVCPDLYEDDSITCPDCEGLMIVDENTRNQWWCEKCGRILNE